MPAAHDKQRWMGRVGIRPGIGFFRGLSGDNVAHRHWAHQLSISLGGKLSVFSSGQRYEAEAVFIPANTPHQLLPGPVLSIYLDPTSRMATGLSHRFFSAVPIVTLLDVDRALLSPLLVDPCSMETLAACLQRWVPEGSVPEHDPRLAEVIALLESGIREQGDVSRQELADTAHLSESRFSHWFKEQTGMPLRSYRKWLRLIQGTEKALLGQKLAAAAQEASFSDQAHFSRTFYAAFGVSPADALSHLEMPAGRK